MKTKLRILLFLMLFFCLTVTSVSPLQAIGIDDAPVATKDLPSTLYLSKEKRSIAGERLSSPLAAPTRSLLQQSRAVGDWDDPFMPGEAGDWSATGNVGAAAPIGDISLPVVMSILFLYMIYRGVTTSRRRNKL